ncbi:hypothetical protein LTR72_010922 [Exophiala xenobiotica]|nr:hypothetical protein LTR72_010922 [Exophiala xenobiotica]KAK5285501.1 hypothetical protein LTR14_010897 [Exophiala xenobiotica]KAK5470529.1 hypothetical protein LTR55_010938 [Exophiala xenobiotica]
MDLLATVRKEGSRGGRGDFQWSDVQTSSHRENYLGHSLMAPVGRWQKGRDLNWFAKGDKDADTGEDADVKAARERKEEIRRIKEAEEDALATALGLPVAPRNNPNMEMLGAQREVGKVLKEAAEEDGLAGTGGVGYGRTTGVSGAKEEEATTERLAEGAMANGDSAVEVESGTRMAGLDDGTETTLIDTEIGDSARPKTGTRADDPDQSHLKEIGPTDDARDHEVGLLVVDTVMMSTDVMKMQDETTADETLIGGG